METTSDDLVLWRQTYTAVFTLYYATLFFHFAYNMRLVYFIWPIDIFGGTYTFFSAFLDLQLVLSSIFIIVLQLSTLALFILPENFCARISSSVVGSKVGEKMQFSTDGWKFPTEEIHGCSKFHFAPNSPKIGDFHPKILKDKPVVDVARDAQCCAQAVADRHTDRWMDRWIKSVRQ